MEKLKNIHFFGIKGVGMTPLAIIAKEAGYKVTGCDVAEEFITDDALRSAGINPAKEFSPEHIRNIDLLIATGAHKGSENPEVKEAIAMNMPFYMQGEALGAFMEGKIFHRKFKGISVAGCHGKTTTTAMIATVFSEAGLDPSYVVGTSDIRPLGLPGHYGKGDYFIAEADEYATDPINERTPKFLWQHPTYTVITNIEYDHPDIYDSIDEVREAYLVFAANTVRGGTLITNGDDKEVRKILELYKRRTITFGFESENDYVLQKVSVAEGQTIFTAASREKDLGKFVLNVFGEHNALNALASVIVSLEAGISLDTIKKGLFLFGGTKRRTELIGKTSRGALLYDDYAHHPTEIRKTLDSLRKQFTNKKIITIFQPHTFSRTKLLFDQFSSSFADADAVIVTNIFPSAREAFDPSVSSEALVASMAPHHKESIFLPDPEDVVKYINEKKLGSDYVIVIMGAGDIYKIADKLLIEEQVNFKS